MSIIVIERRIKYHKFREDKKDDNMTKFISNVNKYLSEMKIKQTYLCRVTGIDKNKISRLLTGAQEESGSDMEKIARGLGKNVEFFLSDSICIPQAGKFATNKIAFYAGEPSQKQEQIANQLMELMENIDEVISAGIRFANIARG
ncbi:MAG: helix-turn-helix transcriptional regulator [Lachnospiraceae bacterium]|nr:helix-turn-helix transcriptional regulator [Lachnospiraceae bacterium]